MLMKRVSPCETTNTVGSGVGGLVAAIDDKGDGLLEGCSGELTCVVVEKVDMVKLAEPDARLLAEDRLFKLAELGETDAGKPGEDIDWLGADAEGDGGRPPEGNIALETEPIDDPCPV